ncbi:hypothetical protein OG613_08095 [Streptomyces sp. NBC_00015]|uniref:hypothetical protein n=1 Tax=unclassified Streptomyces TaxID=2593676 RepID=UPI00225805CC|nr:hypothetical protein [Streptomyces sp. NBC_00103]MCX5374174.1 hypothetical protein [Streptomyces sp. NBC_00103]
MSEPDWKTELRAAVEAAIGLNVDCGGAAGVYRVRDAVMEAIQPHGDAAFARGLMAGSSKADYRLVQEKGRLRRELARRRTRRTKERGCVRRACLPSVPPSPPHLRMSRPKGRHRDPTPTTDHLGRLRGGLRHLASGSNKPENSIRWDAADEHDEDAFRRLLKLLFSPRADSGTA